MINKIPVKNEILESIGYNLKSETLEIELENGEIRDYLNVPEHIYHDLMNSNRKKSFFLTYIKGNYKDIILKSSLSKFRKEEEFN